MYCQSRIFFAPESLEWIRNLFSASIILRYICITFNKYPRFLYWITVDRPPLMTDTRLYSFNDKLKPLNSFHFLLWVSSMSFTGQISKLVIVNRTTLLHGLHTNSVPHLMLHIIMPWRVYCDSQWRLGDMWRRDRLAHSYLFICFVIEVTLVVTDAHCLTSVWSCAQDLLLLFDIHGACVCMYMFWMFYSALVYSGW